MKVNAFKCDICKTLMETKPETVFLDIDERTFKVMEYSIYPSIDKEACSDDCVKAALDAWLKKRNDRKEQRPSFIVGDLVLPNGEAMRV